MNRIGGRKGEATKIERGLIEQADEIRRLAFFEAPRQNATFSISRGRMTFVANRIWLRKIYERTSAFRNDAEKSWRGFEKERFGNRRKS